MNTATPDNQSIVTTRTLRRVAIGLFAGVFILSAMALLADVRDLGKALQDFNWWIAIPVLLLTSWNYFWRFVKWQMYLAALSVHGLSTRLSAQIYLSGFAMSLTPGKVGELIKAMYVKRETGTPADRCSAAVAAERITDAIAMLILAGIGALEYSYGRLFLGVIAAGSIVVIALLQQPKLLETLLDKAERISIVARFRHNLDAFLDASSDLMRGRMLINAVGLGVVSWVGECIAFFLILVGLKLEPSWHLLLTATFILAVSSLAGGASMLPGGLGVADAGVAGMLILLVKDEPMSTSLAIAATLLIRFATLWFAVIIGAISLLTLERTHRKRIRRANAI